MFVTQREAYKFSAVCSPAQQAALLQLATYHRVLVVEVPETAHGHTFGHFVERVVGKRSLAMPLALRTKRRPYFKSLGFENYTDFEEYFGLPNNTNTKWNSTKYALKTANEVYEATEEIVGIKLDDIEGTKPHRYHLNDDCFAFASTRPVNDVWTALRNVPEPLEIRGLHVRTGYADFADEMDRRVSRLHQFDVRYADLFDEASSKSGREWMDLDYAARSPRRTGKEFCSKPLFELLRLSRTVACLDQGGGLVLATDHAKYQTIMNSIVRHSTLLSPLNKTKRDVYGHAKHSRWIDYKALGMAAAIEFHLLTWCDTLVVYGDSFFSRAANWLSVGRNATLVSLDLAYAVPSLHIGRPCASCYSSNVCGCVINATAT